ncbi:MAG: hydantoin racemase [Desulfurococcales archaeon ex4484_42]|nr:MAG: hydantoin racemase [Desulfurococcales archaeon ex4484_42]
MKVLVINPVGHDTWDKQDEEIYRGYASSETEIRVVSLPKGPATVERPEDHAEVIPLVIDVAKKMYRDFDAIIVNCFLDPGVKLLRGIIEKPVIGPCEASLHIASTIGSKLSVITVGKHDTTWMIEDRIKELGFSDRVVSVRGIPLGVMDINKERTTVINYLIEESKKAVSEDGTDVIILGCTGLAGMAKEVQEKVKVPVVDPSGAAIKMAEALVKLGLFNVLVRR